MFFGDFFGLFRENSVCFGCFDTGPKHRNKPKKMFFGFDSHQYYRYSIVAITQRYIFALSQNVFNTLKKVTAFRSYRSRLIEIVIAS
jgi:hypothetical protein